MYDKIAHLISQAEAAADTEYAQRQTGYSREDIFRQKFAKLIVRTCANWIVDNAGTMDHLGPEHFAQAMKNTFGVDR